MTDAREIELKPCPFCGSADVDADFAFGYDAGDESRPTISAGCNKCNTTGPDVCAIDRELAIVPSSEAWNTRPMEESIIAALAAKDARIAELEAIAGAEAQKLLDSIHAGAARELAAKDAKLAELTRVYEQNELLLRRLLKDERDKIQQQAAEIERLNKYINEQIEDGAKETAALIAARFEIEQLQQVVNESHNVLRRVWGFRSSFDSCLKSDIKKLINHPGG